MTIAERRDQLRHDTDRWIRELDGATARATLSVGVLKKACTHAEGLLRSCASMFLTPGDVAQAVRKASDGKTTHLDKLTMGECIKLLIMLDGQKALSPPKRVIGKADRELLDNLSSARNRFIHHADHDTEAMIDLLTKARRVADLRLVELAVRVEATVDRTAVS